MLFFWLVVLIIKRLLRFGGEYGRHQCIASDANMRYVGTLCSVNGAYRAYETTR